MGLAVVSPRGALALAADRAQAGRSGTDLLLAIVLVMLATELRGLVAAVWLGHAVDWGLGARAAVAVLTRALTVELGVLVVAGIVLFAVGGRRRNMGRALDLACVAVLPVMFVALAVNTVVRVVDLAPLEDTSSRPTDASGMVRTLIGEPVSFVLAALSYAWVGALTALAIAPARAPVVSNVVAPPAIATRGKRAGVAVLALVAIGLAAQIAWLARTTEDIRPMVAGDAAPPFRLASIAEGGVAGPPVELEARKGKVVVVDFWATWCGPCLKAMPKLESLARRYHGELEIIAINLDDPAAARELWDTRGYTMTLAGDDGDASHRYGVSTIPHTVLIDREGVVRLVARGAGDLESAIAREAKQVQIRN